MKFRMHWLVLCFASLVNGCAAEELNPIPSHKAGDEWPIPERPSSPGDQQEPPKDDPSGTPKGCVVTSSLDHGYAVIYPLVTGSPSGFLTAWYREWGVNASMQVFDRQGEPFSDEAQITNSSHGLLIVSGLKNGYLVGSSTLGFTNILMRLDPKGSFIGSTVQKAQVATAGKVDYIGWSDPVYDTDNAVWNWITKLASVSASGLVGTPAIAASTSDGQVPIIRGMAAIEEVIAIGYAQELGTNGGSYNTTIELSLLIHDGTSTTESVFHNSFGSPYPFILDVFADDYGFAVFWGTNDPDAGDYPRYLTYITKGGDVGLTYELPPSVVDIAAIENGFAAVIYDESILTLTFARLTKTGKVSDELVLRKKAKFYYLGRPEIAASASDRFLMVWIEEPSFNDTHFTTAFISCN